MGTTEQSDEKVVYLTLDDGPSKNTQAVLDILDKYNAKATFFVTGAMPEYKDMIKKAYDKGHTIGMHTYSHDYAKVYASVDAYFQDLDQIGQLVKKKRSAMFRVLSDFREDLRIPYLQVTRREL